MPNVIPAPLIVIPATLRVILAPLIVILAQARILYQWRDEHRRSSRDSRLRGNDEKCAGMTIRGAGMMVGLFGGGYFVDSLWGDVQFD